jgi:quercetin 2,3-dioxygenase
MITKIGTDKKTGKQHGGFGIEILFPGKAIASADSGIGTIGRIDQATVSPGTLVQMHPHQDDEILTYLRSGTVEHKDSEGHVEIITNKIIMMMNAGALFQHEEQVLENSDVLTALQIFFRPEAGGLTPKVQFHDFSSATTTNKWRAIAGKESSYPLQVRSSSWLHDIQMETGNIQSLPIMPVKDATCLIYLFAGEITVNENINLKKGESVLVENETIELKALQTSDVVIFITDKNSTYFKDGMYSGNVQ